MIVVTGVSGVGKTYTIQALAAQTPSFRYVRASQILSELGLPTRDLSAAQTRENQIALASALKELEGRGGASLIIDGHAVIETVDGPVDASFSDYTQLPMTMIVNIRDDPSVIAQRRLEKGKTHPAEHVSALQDAEEASSEMWARRLAVPFHVVKSGDVDHLLRILTRRDT